MVIACSCNDNKRDEVFCESSEIVQSDIKSTDVDSLGVIWVVTIDNTGSMLKTEIVKTETGNKKNKIAEYVSDKLKQKNIFESVNFEKDRFLFFCSGHLYRGKWEDRCEVLNSKGNFDSSFIHFSNYAGSKLYSFKNTDDLINMIKRQTEYTSYAYQLSFVSQICIFSLVKAMKYLQKENLTKDFRHLKIITITDDADQNDQWQQDYRTLKDCSPKLLQNINNTNVRYVYNQFTERGFGSLDEFFKCDSVKNVPHIWGYNYTTKQSLPEKSDNKKHFILEAIDGKNFKLKPKASNYNGDKILFFCLDTLIVNGTAKTFGKRFEDSLHINLSYKNGFYKNKFIVKGSFQVLYNDSIWGEHYKKYFYEQTEELETAYRTATINKAKNAAIILLALFVLWIAVILPNLKLFVIYDNQGRKFVIRRGWKWYWKSGTIPVLSYVFDKEQSEVIHKKSVWIKQKTHCLDLYKEYTSDYEYEYKNDDDEILIVSRYKLTVPSSVLLTKSDTKCDIEHHYCNKSTEYKMLFESAYKQTRQYKIRNKMKSKKIRNKQRFRKLLLFVVNVFFCKRYYLIKNSSTERKNIRFTVSRWKNRTFVVERAKFSGSNFTKDFQQLSLMCLNDYFIKNVSAKRIIGVCKTADSILWTVVQPEFIQDHQSSLKYAYNVFQFEQERTQETEEQTKKNLKALKRTIKSETGRCQKIVCYLYESLEQEQNLHNFEIFENPCLTYLYLEQDDEKWRFAYSPFRNDFNSKQIKMFGLSNLYYSFSLVKHLPKNYETQKLWNKKSEKLYDYSENKETVFINDLVNNK